MTLLHDSLRRGALGILMLGAAASAWGIPAVRESFKVLQPDGTELTLRLIGDARSHIYLTEDGCPVVYDPELGYVHASVSADGTRIPTRLTAHDAPLRDAAERRAARPMSAAEVTEAVADKGYGLSESTFPVTGKVRTLVILAEFADVKFGSQLGASYKYGLYSESADPVYDYWNDLLNKSGFDGFGAQGSCRDWFLHNSADADGNPQFEPQFDLYGPVTLPNNVAYYGRNALSGSSVDQAAEKMIVDACRLLDDEIDYSLYDTDGDGRVDNVFVLYAGLGENDGGGADTVWPHAWDLSYTGSSFEADGVTIDHYACSKETLYSTRMPDGIGTILHEFSHVLGLPDLYSTDYTSAYTPGKFSVLDAGPYNNNSRTPPNYSAYERWALGWMKPSVFADSGTYTLGNMADTREVYLVPTEKETEYYLVENRQQTGWDAYLPGHGMLIWHIDYKREVYADATVNNDPYHQHVDLIEANVRKNERYASGHPFPGESGVRDYDFVSWSGTDCGVDFSDIAETPDGDVTVSVAVAGSGVGNIDSEADTEAWYYDLQGRRIHTPAPGQIVIRCTGSGTRKVTVK
ncbi:MAG: M6 family metalloprotease domain-containing protein [Bacteroides sp.]|nr:M6 family metalloprotease domain-containing protein [Bacteroides sp.]